MSPMPLTFSQLNSLKIGQISLVVLSFVVTGKVTINYYFLDTFKKIEVNKKSKILLIEFKDQMQFPESHRLRLKIFHDGCY